MTTKTVLSILNAACLTAALIFSFAGCEPTDNNGGGTDKHEFYTTTDEQPGFGDPEILAMTEDTDYNDPFDNSKAFKAGEKPDAIYVRVVWGNLSWDVGNIGWTNYNGRLEIDDGLLIVERTIHFEFKDSFVVDRTDPQSVSWNSRTWTHYDGLLVRIEPGSTTAGQNMLRIDIGDAFHRELSVADLFDEVFIDSSGQDSDNIALASHLGNIDNAGFLSGHWRKYVASSGGAVKGKWENSQGDLLGYERAQYFPGPGGTGQVFGKVIDTNGKFLWLLSGEIQSDNTDEITGAFSLGVLDSSEAGVGSAKGVYKKETGEAFGFFQGNYSYN